MTDFVSGIQVSAQSGSADFLLHAERIRRDCMTSSGTVDYTYFGDNTTGWNAWEHDGHGADVDALYIGHSVVFPEVSMKVTTPSTVNIVTQYWNGATWSTWAATDDLFNVTANTRVTIPYTGHPVSPGDWALTTTAVEPDDLVQSLYWMRIKPAATGATIPKLTKHRLNVSTFYLPDPVEMPLDYLFLGGEHQMAGGKRRVVFIGMPRTVGFSWQLLHFYQADYIRALAQYRDKLDVTVEYDSDMLTGLFYVDWGRPPHVEPIAATDPVRYNAELSLAESDWEALV